MAKDTRSTQIPATLRSMDERLRALEAWLAPALAGRAFRLEPASTDASFRRYFRVFLDEGRTLIAMDAPPPPRDVVSMDAPRDTVAMDAPRDAVTADAPRDTSTPVDAGPSSSRQTMRVIGYMSAPNGFYEYLPPGYAPTGGTGSPLNPIAVL